MAMIYTLRTTSERSPSTTQIPPAATSSQGFGEKMRKKPRSFTKAAKLETQNGVTKSLRVGQGSRRMRCLPERVVFTSDATQPMIPLNPRDVSQIAGLGSELANQHDEVPNEVAPQHVSPCRQTGEVSGSEAMTEVKTRK